MEVVDALVRHPDEWLRARFARSTNDPRQCARLVDDPVPGVRRLG
ncbi:hypothetical protein ACNPQM_00065 [Streptomyces sp. NPDC056231]